MTYQLKPIVITPAQITAAAQAIANHSDDGSQYTEAQWLTAVEHYLRCKVNDILADPDWHAHHDHFNVERTCDYPTCQASPAAHSIVCVAHAGYCTPDEASEFFVPPPPVWATEIAQRPELKVEPDGNILWA